MTDECSVPLVCPEKLSPLSLALESRLTDGLLDPECFTSAAGGALRSADRQKESPPSGPDLIGAAAA